MFTLHRRRLLQAQNRRKCPQPLLKVGRRRRPVLEQEDALDRLGRRKVQPLTTLAAGGRWMRVTAFTQL